MRRRIVRLTVTAAVLAIALFGIPLAAIVSIYLFDDERSELARAAETGALRLSAELARGQALVAIPDLEPDITATLYDQSGTRVSGTGPNPADAQTRLALSGRVAAGDDGDDLVEAAPVLDDGDIAGVLRVATSRSVIYPRIGAVWAAMLALGTLAVGLVWLVARRQGARLAHPLEQLAHSARRIGDGDFAVRTQASDIPEIDAVGTTLDRTAARIGDMIARERAFSADASHQLRTPLAGLRLGLETALDPPVEDLEKVIKEAIGSTDRLERTIDELLALARDTTPSAGPFLLDELLSDVREHWHGVFAAAGRPLRIHVADELPRAAASNAAVRQIISVLLDNAHRHGHGAVTLRVRDAADALALDVTDEGTAIPHPENLFARTPGPDGHGIGLALARSLALAEGGRLLFSSTAPVTFTLILPLGHRATE
jgi:signal transduction histidine kinase